MEGSEHDAEKIERLRRAMYSRALSENLQDKPRRELDAEGAQVPEDFVREADAGSPQTIVAPRAIGIVRAALWWLLAAALVFFLASLAFFGYYFFFGPGSGDASSSNIDIAISGPPQVEGGAPAEFQISVGNRNKVPIELADLVITYPDGTRSPADYVTSLTNQRIPLGTIESGGVRQGTVSAVLSGTAGQTADIKVELDYHIGGSSAIFTANTDYTVTFSSAPLGISVDGNSEAISGQPVQLAVTVSSNTDAPVKDVLLSATYPFGFKFNSSVPAPTQNGIWAIGDLNPGDKKIVTINGTLTGTKGDQRVFRFDAGTRVDSASSTISTQLADLAYTTTITQPFLDLTSVVNGSPGTVVLSPGDSVTVTIGWQNNLSTPITSAAIVAQLTGLQIDGTTVKATNGFYRSTQNVVLWDKSTDPDLATIAPGAKGTVSFSFQVPTSGQLASTTSPHLDISVNVAGNRLSESGVPENLQSAVSQEIAIASDLQLAAQGLYYTNPFGTSGPIPPKAGSETNYAILFTLTNSTNQITNGQVTASLPPYVRWVGIYSPNTEKVSFDQVRGTVTWDLGTINPGAGLNGTPSRQMAIDIGFTPSTSQIGQQPPLLQQITFTGIDSSTGAAIKRTTSSDVTTNLLQVAKTSNAVVVGTDTGFSAANADVVK